MWQVQIQISYSFMSDHRHLPIRLLVMIFLLELPEVIHAILMDVLQAINRQIVRIEVIGGKLVDQGIHLVHGE